MYSCSRPSNIRGLRQEVCQPSYTLYSFIVIFVNIGIYLSIPLSFFVDTSQRIERSSPATAYHWEMDEQGRRQ